MTTYVLDNEHRAADAHHDAQADLLDPSTRSRIQELTGGDLAGKRCLELGAGYGSVARWLAEQVGDGQVVAVDLKPERIPPHPALVPVAHRIGPDHPLPPAYAGDGFDLIHARLLLIHLPYRDAVLTRLVGLLRPGGLLLLEDWAARRSGWVVDAPDQASADLYERCQRALGSAFDGNGVDPTWAQRIHVAMTRQGLIDVQTVIFDGYWTAGSPGLRGNAAVIAQLRPRLLDRGLTEDDLDRLMLLYEHPGLVVHGHPLYSTSGRRPA